MVDLADTLALGASGRKAMQVQVLFPAPLSRRSRSGLTGGLASRRRMRPASLAREASLKCRKNNAVALVDGPEGLLLPQGLSIERAQVIEKSASSGLLSLISRWRTASFFKRARIASGYGDSLGQRPGIDRTLGLPVW